MERGLRVYPPASRKEQNGARPAAFVAGSLSWDWIEAADRAGALKVALHLHRIASIRKARRFPVYLKQTAEMLGICRHTLRRKLERLQDAGIIDVKRKVGKWPDVYLRWSPTVRGERKISPR
jgi:hypothetical protein